MHARRSGDIWSASCCTWWGFACTRALPARVPGATPRAPLDSNHRPLADAAARGKPRLGGDCVEIAAGSSPARRTLHIISAPTLLTVLELCLLYFVDCVDCAYGAFF